jgi:hypothetical protein
MSTQEDGALVWIAFPRPFRFIYRNEGDKWTATLADIQSNNYDYLRLHRLTGSIDISSPEKHVYVGFAGTLVLPCFGKHDAIESVAQRMNCLLGQILLGGVVFNSIELSDIALGVLYPTGYYRVVDIPRGEHARHMMTLQECCAGSYSTGDLLDAPQLPMKQITDALNSGMRVHASIPTLSVELLLQAFTAMIWRKWPESLSCFWICAEQVLSWLWDEKIVRKADHIGKGRIEFLKDHRTWTIAAKCELLHHCNHLDSKLLGELNSARKARNEFAHKGNPPTQMDVQNLAQAVVRLLGLMSSSDPQGLTNVLTASLNAQDVNPAIRVKHVTAEEVSTIKSGAARWFGPLHAIPGQHDWKGKYYSVFEGKEVDVT